MVTTMEYEDVFAVEEVSVEEDIHRLRLDDIDQVATLIQLYSDIDVPREPVELFKQHLLKRNDSWFVEVGEVGLIYLTNIVPTFAANFNVIFWDRRFGKARRSLCQQVIATGMNEFELTRVAAFVPETNVPLAQTELRKIGFQLEGKFVKAWRDEMGDCNLLAFGLLKEEVKEWQILDQLMISSELLT